MIQFLEGFYSQFIPNNENFNVAYGGGDTKPSFLPLLFALLTIQILILLFGKYLWNNYLVKYVTIVKPVKSVVDLLAISLILALIFPK